MVFKMFSSNFILFEVLHHNLNNFVVRLENSFDNIKIIYSRDYRHANSVNELDFILFQLKNKSKIEQREREREQKKTIEQYIKLIILRWPLSSFLPYHFLVLHFSLLLSFVMSPLFLTTVCRYSIAYTFYRITHSRCSLCRSSKRTLYFRTSNYQNNTHIHTPRCYATEPQCCYLTNRSARSFRDSRMLIHFQI